MKKLLALLLVLVCDPLLSQEVDLSNATQSGQLIQNPYFEACTINQNLPTCGTAPWNNTGLGDWTTIGNSSVEYVFSYDMSRLWQNIDIIDLNTNQFGYLLDFSLNASCKNSIGGFCENPFGPEDYFSVRLNFFSGESLYQQDILLDGPTYTQGWTQLPFSGIVDSPSQITMIQLEFYGQDAGFWAGFYGPRVDNVTFSILYNEIVDIAVDCELYPYDQTCIIQDLTDFTDEEDVMLADENTGDDGSDDGSEVVEEEEEETFVAYEDIDETELEEMLQDIETNEEVMVAEANEREILYRELTDEEKAQILADSISKNALEFALSVSESAASATAATTTETTTTTMTKSLVNVGDDKSDEKVTDTNENKEQVADNNTDSATDLLEIGRSIGIAALSATMSQTEQSASDSINQAESIAMGSSENNTYTIIETITIENVIDNTNNVASTGNSDFDSDVHETSTVTLVEETVANAIEQSIIEIDSADSFSDIMNIDIAPVDTAQQDIEFVQSVLANISQSNDDSNTNTFSEDEQVTIQNDPNLSNAFNVIPNTNNLEILGVLNNKQEEKTDAEKRADQAVAANKEQQEEINKNYMDADQSGIVAAMGADTDVSTYRSAMLNDNNIWYKPEDIYKNVVYKDNVRGAYFLEKGNTDTYKKMVEEQYK